MYHEELYEKNKRLSLAIRQEDYELAARILKEIEALKAHGPGAMRREGEGLFNDDLPQFTGYMRVQLTDEGLEDFEEMVKSHLFDEVKFFPGVKIEDLERIIRMSLWGGILYAAHNPQNIRRQIFFK